MTAVRTAWLSGMRITADRLAADGKQSGTVTVSLSSATSLTTVVTFPDAFSSIPSVMTNINSGFGSIARWQSRAISVSTTDFTLFIFRGDAGDSAVTLADIPVQWTAVMPDA